MVRESRDRDGSRTLSIFAAWLGMIILDLAVAETPSTRAILAEPPSAAVVLSMENSRFATGSVDLRADQATAIVLINHDSGPHTFDIDALVVHVTIRSGGTS